ncbi:MAG: phytase [Haliscomenobacter sp.]|nr:phytase [Haliscomenobacter sp.]
MIARFGMLLFFIAATVFSCRKKEVPNSFVTIVADVETEPVREAVDQDAADDPAIWVHPLDSSQSLVYGTVKGFGIEAYDLAGKRKFSYPIGNPNNIDVAYGFVLSEGRAVDLVGCSEREKNEIRLFSIDSIDGALKPVERQAIKSSVDEIYGFCFFRSRQSGSLYAFANGKNGVVEQWLLKPEAGGKISAKMVRTLRVSTQPEGMVADEARGLLYVGEEDKGIWRFQAEPTAPSSGTLLKDSGLDNPRISFDVEGLCLFPLSDTTGYLLASSQGNFTFAVFERQGANRYLGSFKIGDGPHSDGVGETDGLEVSPRNFGGPFSSGMLVTQDGENTNQSKKPAPQNFKYISWDRVREAIGQFSPIR